MAADAGSGDYRHIPTWNGDCERLCVLCFGVCAFGPLVFPSCVPSCSVISLVRGVFCSAFSLFFCFFVISFFVISVSSCFYRSSCVSCNFFGDFVFRGFALCCTRMVVCVCGRHLFSFCYHISLNLFSACFCSSLSVSYFVIIRQSLHVFAVFLQGFQMFRCCCNYLMRACVPSSPPPPPPLSALSPRSLSQNPCKCTVAQWDRSVVTRSWVHFRNHCLALQPPTWEDTETPEKQGVIVTHYLSPKNNVPRTWPRTTT